MVPTVKERGQRFASRDAWRGRPLTDSALHLGRKRWMYRPIGRTFEKDLSPALMHDYPSNIRIAAICLALLCFQCGSLQRDNPLHPSASQPGNGEETTLSLVIPLPKALARIVDRIFARLEAPGMQRSSSSSTTRLWGLRRSSSAPSPQVRDVLCSSRASTLMESSS